MLKKIFALLLFAFGCITPALALPVGTLHGFLRDPMLGRPVYPVLVRVDEGGTVRQTVTDRHGWFSFLGVPAGPVNVTVSVTGYAPMTLHTCITPNETRVLELLAPEPMTLPQAYGLQAIPERYFVQDKENALHPVMTQTQDEYTIGPC